MWIAFPCLHVILEKQKKRENKFSFEGKQLEQFQDEYRLETVFFICLPFAFYIKLYNIIYWSRLVDSENCKQKNKKSPFLILFYLSSLSMLVKRNNLIKKRFKVCFFYICYHPKTTFTKSLQVEEKWRKVFLKVTIGQCWEEEKRRWKNSYYILTGLTKFEKLK